MIHRLTVVSPDLLVDLEMSNMYLMAAEMRRQAREHANLKSILEGLVGLARNSIEVTHN